MTTLGWLLILLGLLTIRQVSRGRVTDIGTDLSDALLALAAGDTDALGEILTRTGPASTPTAADLAIFNLTAGVTTGITDAGVGVSGAIGAAATGLQNRVAQGLALNAVVLGTKAKGYRWAATGPDYYDCSGLMWRACQAVGYKGIRFTTATVGAMPGFTKIPARSANVDDLVVWPTHHMGVITGDNKFYSARNPKSGIGETTISGFRKDAPVYYRFRAK
jgi:cell wall-associated NlpC family hydrolase